jgi:hypothetical protein
VGTITVNGGTLAGGGAIGTELLNLIAGNCGGTGDLAAKQVNWTGGSFNGTFGNLSLTRTSGDFDLPGPLTASGQLSLAAPNGMLRVGNSVRGGNIALSGVNMHIAAPVAATGGVTATTPGALVIDNTSGSGSLTAGGNIAIQAGSLQITSGAVPVISGLNVRVDTDGPLTLDGGSVSAVRDLNVISGGALQVLGDNAAAKLLAGGAMNIGAGTVLVRAGSHGASIDPTSLFLTTPGDVVLEGGAAPALIAGDTVTIVAANVLLTGGVSGYAAIEALSGDLNVGTPLSGKIVLTPGSGVNTDAALVAPAGSVARLLTGQCIGCGTLPGNPLLNPPTETGVFGGTIEITVLNPGDVVPPTNGVIQATVLALTAASAPGLYEAPSDDKNRKKRSIPACPVR